MLRRDVKVKSDRASLCVLNTDLFNSEVNAVNTDIPTGPWVFMKLHVGNYTRYKSSYPLPVTRDSKQNIINSVYLFNFVTAGRIIRLCLY